MHDDRGAAALDSLPSFQQLLTHVATAHAAKPPALLLGGGFARGFDPERYATDSLDVLLREACDDPMVHRELDDADGDIEDALVELEQMTRCAGEVSTQAREAIQNIMNAVPAITRRLEPQQDGDSAADRFKRARRCLAVLERFDSIFSVSFDPVLHWVLTRKGEQHPHFQDGFDTSDPITEDHAVGPWSPREHPPRVHWIHGAFHIFHSGRHVDRVRIPDGQVLSDRVEHAIAKGLRPSIVCAKNEREKEQHVRDSPSMAHAREALTKLDRPLVIYGCSLRPEDEHVVQAIRSSRCPVVYLCLWNPTSAADTPHLVQRAKELRTHPKLSGTRKVALIDSTNAPFFVDATEEAA